MKKVKVMFVATALLIGSLASTAATVPTNPVKDPTATEISGLLQNPSFEVTGDLTAMVSFMLNDDNEIVVISVDTESENVERFVKSRLNYQEVASTLEQGKAYKVPVRIVSES